MERVGKWSTIVEGESNVKNRKKIVFQNVWLQVMKVESTNIKVGIYRTIFYNYYVL